MPIYFRKRQQLKNFPFKVIMIPKIPLDVSDPPPSSFLFAATWFSDRRASAAAKRHFFCPLKGLPVARCEFMLPTEYVPVDTSLCCPPKGFRGGRCKFGSNSSYSPFNFWVTRLISSYAHRRRCCYSTRSSLVDVE